ncbi:hypothetical protein [Actinomycetospora termitidis]|uniref:Uncharacterized protein n=1 Tax=Actinomycetospora termitidis TaxID=3053470 RepID=A0ABT7MDJ3_9PSEU|nr:hypothetical protein [Actinomycetospora sp. Odt1-22]MDL5158718.1 hypothetical protein [Actinomycetospora sp. Odt1-22]
MRDVEYSALTDWLADGASAAAGTAEAELAADWSRVTSSARWTRLTAAQDPEAPARTA